MEGSQPSAAGGDGAPTATNDITAAIRAVYVYAGLTDHTPTQPALPMLSESRVLSSIAVY